MKVILFFKLEISRPEKTPSKGGVRKVWTEEEAAAFVEALELYGRDWKKCAEHIKTKTSKCVASRAQKYFIYLYSKDIPLPQKVQESGNGYTLSGKPLDPDSAAAIAYGIGGADATKKYRLELKRRRLEKIRQDESIIKS